MNAHPATNLFPLMNQEDLGAMAEDIRKNGLLHPVIITADGLVLDGRNRLKACELANVEPRFEAWEPNGATPTAWVIATNLHRRHLTASQRSAVAAEALPLLAAEAKKRQGSRTDLHGTLVSIDNKVEDAHHGKPGRATRIAGEMFGVGAAQVARGKVVQQRAPEVFEAVKRGERSMHGAYVEVTAPPEPRTQTEREKMRAAAHRRRFVEALASIGGTCRGLEEIDYALLLKGLSDPELATWRGQLKDAAAVLRLIERRLKSDGTD